MAVVQWLGHRGSDQSPIIPGRSIFCLSPAAPLGQAGRCAAVGSCGCFSGLPKGTAKPSDVLSPPVQSFMQSMDSMTRQRAPYHRVCSLIRAFMVAAFPPPMGEYTGCPSPCPLNKHGALFTTEPLGATSFSAHLWAYIFLSSLKACKHICE